jgi:amidase
LSTAVAIGSAGTGASIAAPSPSGRPMPIELTLDHTGPMTATVEDNALLLDVLAGPDGLDPRQYGGAVAKPYREALGRGAGALKIAVVEEGFGHPQSSPQVDSLVR